MSLPSHWPLFGLRLRTPGLELRLPDPDDLAALADLAAAGIHDPAVQPFVVPWTDAEPAERARRVLRWHWRGWADWAPEAWALNLVVFRDGRVVGTQTVSATEFAIRAEVATGSWLGRAHHGQGIGTEMRAAVLDLAFAHLGAHAALSGAFEDNAASYGVSRTLGYEHDGIDTRSVRGEPAVMRRLRLTRARWEAHRRVPVEVSGLAPCLAMFGIESPPEM
ncbi:GNAT family N-acetyltransferase [Nocardia sp. NPDC004068]|uniref:GNAT family N-acetyltransferase n=1 Tax=Nocardia sp. NPDC004068 TaxID=3364303 RepID=UPI003681E4D2